MGPNTDSKELLLEYANAGMDIARLNFSHGDHEEQLGRIENIRWVREQTGVPIAMLLDTQGPEIRTGLLKEDKIQLQDGQTFTLTTEDIKGDTSRVSVTYKNLPSDVVKGNTILIDDGLIELKVVSVEETEIHCTVINGGSLSQKKGINIPNVSVKLPAITEKDKKDIIFGIEQDVDFIAASFVRSERAILEIKELLAEHDAAHINIIAKIENMEGIENLDAIIQAADGVMVARGDLGVEVPASEVPYLQKRIINKCNAAFKPVITATQMLDSMIRNPRPTRAEVTDVSNAINEGTDAIMLSGETAMGKYPVEAIKMMVEIAETTELHIDFDESYSYINKYKTRGISNAVAYSAVETAKNLQADAIIIPTISGFSARVVSKYKPSTQIIALTPRESARRKMQIYWGVLPLLIDAKDDLDEMLDVAIGEVKANDMIKDGDIAIVTAGLPIGKTGVTNMIKVMKID